MKSVRAELTRVVADVGQGAWKQRRSPLVRADVRHHVVVPGGELGHRLRPQLPSCKPSTQVDVLSTTTHPASAGDGSAVESACNRVVRARVPRRLSSFAQYVIHIAQVMSEHCCVRFCVWAVNSQAATSDDAERVVLDMFWSQDNSSSPKRWARRRTAIY